MVFYEKWSISRNFCISQEFCTKPQLSQQLLGKGCLPTCWYLKLAKEKLQGVCWWSLDVKTQASCLCKPGIKVRVCMHSLQSLPSDWGLLASPGDECPQLSSTKHQVYSVSHISASSVSSYSYPKAAFKKMLWTKASWPWNGKKLILIEVSAKYFLLCMSGKKEK